MIYVEARSEDLPAADRPDWWREKVRQWVVPMAAHRDQRTELRSTARRLDLGEVQVTRLSNPSVQCYRGAKFIRQFDPERIHLDLTLRGRTSIALAGREATAIKVGDFMLYDTSRPFRTWMFDDEDTCMHVLVQVPRALVPLPSNTVDRLLAVPLPGREGVGALLSTYLTGLVDNAHQYQPGNVARLSTVTVDLLTTLLAHHLDAGTATPYETQQRVLQMRIRDFIQRRLADPRLSPAVIAGAHGISTRYLHKLFHAQHLTVAGWIRQRRLERCRHDLADPHLRSHPVHAIAARWGFTDGAHFSRLFRATYGVPPGDYRRLAHTSDGVRGSSSTVRGESMTS